MLSTRRQGRHLPAHVRRGEVKGQAVATSEVTSSSAAAVAVADDFGPAGGGQTAGTGPTPEAPPAPSPSATTSQRSEQPLRSGRAVLRGVVHRDRALTVGGAKLRLLVLSCTLEDTTTVDLASGSFLRLRIPWPDGHSPDLSAFDVVEATLADDPECDDLAQPEAATVAAPPRHVGSLKGRRVRAMLSRLAARHDGPLLGFNGPSAPYWDFHGLRPSVALINPTRAPQLMRRRSDGSTWVRFGWERDDVWLPVEDARGVRALDASRRDKLTGKPLASALGFSPHYLLVAVSSPRAGHCYKICAAILPKS